MVLRFLQLPKWQAQYFIENDLLGGKVNGLK
jgi:hypothetical protein